MKALTLRIPEALHEQLKNEAWMAKKSLNTYATDILRSYNKKVARVESAPVKVLLNIDEIQSKERSAHDATTYEPKKQHHPKCSCAMCKP